MLKSLLATLLAVLATAASAQATSAPYLGKVLLHCSAVTTAQVDPIAQYGVTPSAHLHLSAGASFTSSGSPIFNATTSPLAPIAAGSQTSCTQFGEGTQSDHDLMWIPQPMNADGTLATVTGVAYYLMNSGYNVQRAPNGLHFVAGNHDYTGPSGSASFQGYGTGCSWYAHTIPHGSGAAGCTGYQESIFGQPQCWLPYLGQGMGDTSPTTAQFSGVDNSTCLANGGIPIPEVELIISVTGGVNGYLSSDVNVGSQTTNPGSTAHFDFVFGFTPNSSGGDALDLIDKGCLNVTGYPGAHPSCVAYQNTIYQGNVDTGNPNLNDPITN